MIGRGLLRSAWRTIRAASHRRLAGTLLLLVVALLLARFSWSFSLDDDGRELPLVVVFADAERSLYDLRVYTTTAQVPQDQRLQIIVYDDQTLIDARKRSPLDRGLLAKALANLDGMGAKAIGIDILFDQPQDEDEQLITTLRAMKTPVLVAHTALATTREDIQYQQQIYLDRFLGRLRGSGARPASIKLDYTHSATRRWPEADPAMPLLSQAMVDATGASEVHSFASYRGAIRERLPLEEDRPVFSSLRIDLFANSAVAPALAEQVRGRYVLIGGDIVGVDRFETPLTPFTGESPPGVLIHAEMLAQALDGAKLNKLPGWQLWAIALLVVLAAALTGLQEANLRRALPLLAVQLVGIAGAPFMLQHWGVDTLGMPAVGLALGWGLALAASSSAARASGAVERRFAQSALGRYLPPDIAQEIIDHPERLTLSGRKADLYILFSDLEGFTDLSHRLEPEVVARLLNSYLDRLSQVVLDHGGLIDKYVGDAVVAFWGAPIARPDDGLRAAKAGYALWREGEAFRHSVDVGVPVGKTRVGLHYGESVVGNFGGERRIQYTALGPAMNTAARLEAANKVLQSSVIASAEFAERSGLDWWRPMGRISLRGVARPIDLREPAPDFPAADRAALEQAVALAAKDPAGAVAIVEAVVSRHPSDDALQNLLMRIRSSGGDAYALG